MKRVFVYVRSLATPQFWLLVAALLVLGFLPVLGHGSAAITHQAGQFIKPIQAHALLEQATVASHSDPNCAVTACLALTFDDGPNPIATPIVLAALEQAQVPATFFVVGSRAVTQPGLLQRMYRDGDEIGNHSWSHPDLTTLSPDQIIQQVQQTQDAVIAAGVPAPTLFRPPYGAINASVENNVHLPLIFWNIDPADWLSQDPVKITAAVEAASKPGGIVELHDIYTSTGAALPGVIANLKTRFTLVTVSQLLNLEPGQQGIFYSR
jgi:peptidoglycan/xylan/chitin deacetylase (PgdA/CDA1 family)